MGKSYSPYIDTVETSPRKRKKSEEMEELYSLLLM